MIFKPYDWADDAAGGTPITAAKLDEREAAIAAANARSAADGLVAKLDQAAASAVVVVLGDSTGAPGSTTWVGDLATRVGARWTGHKVTLRDWGTTSYGAASTIANGSATLTLDIYNGSVSGAKADYPLTRIATMLPAAPDLVLINYGHNHTTDSAATLQTALDTLVTSIRGTHPDAAVVIVGQNPEASPASTATQHNTREQSKRAWAATRGHGYLPAFEAFRAQATLSTYLGTDGVHPTSAGYTLWGGVAFDHLAELTERPVVASSASAVYKGRDRLVAVAGNTTLTLGASPVTGSPLVWVNNVIKWPGTDYTISGSVITFGTALAGSDVVLVYYDTLTSSPPASVLSTPSAGVSITDNFNRTDSTNSLGTTTTGAKTWSQSAGTWGVIANKAYVSSGVAAQTCRAVIDAGVADCTVSSTVSGNGANLGLVFRSDGAGNEYIVEVGTAFAKTPTIFKGTGGSYTTLATGASTTVAEFSVLSVELSGSSIIVKDDGVTIVSATDATYNANTKHGLYIVAPSGSTSLARHDDFSVTS